MLNKLADFIVRRKYIILIVFITLFALSAVGSLFVKVNSDITAFLPPDSKTAEGQVFLRETFSMNGDMSVIVRGPKDLDEASAYLNPKVAAIQGTVSADGKNHVASVMWKGSIDLSGLDGAGEALGIAQEELEAMLSGAIGNLEAFLTADANSETDVYYVINITIDVPSSDPNAVDIYDEAARQFSEELQDGRAALGGTLAGIKQTMDETINSMPIFIAIAVIVVLIILLLTTKSWLEPLILLTSIGVSIIINMGTNLIFGEISVITQAMSAILQLGLTMDYAIFLMHSYHNHLEKYHDPVVAMKKAIPKTVVTIAASALTTVGGFAAMAFMKMGIGLDMAQVLGKGVLISLVTIVFLQPVLMLTFKNLLEKGRHAYIHYDFEKPASVTIKKKGVISLAALVLIAVSAYSGTLAGYDFLKLSEPVQATGAQLAANNMGNQVIVGVPVIEGRERELYRMREEFEKIPNVASATGIFGVIEEEYLDTYLEVYDTVKLATNPLAAAFASPEVIAQARAVAGIIGSFHSMNYAATDQFAVYMLKITCDGESEEGLALLASVTSVLDGMYGEQYYISGIPQAVYDLKEITPYDQMIVSVLSVVFIFVIVLATLKSLKKTLLVVFLIEGGIWINLSIYALAFAENAAGGQFGVMNFISQMVVTALQMGATVDYAILMSSAYKDFRARGFEPRSAAREAAKQSAMSVVTSASILVGACLSLYMISANMIIRQVTLLIAIGAALAAFLIIFVLPGLLVYSDVPLKKLKKMKYFLLLKRKHKVVLTNGDIITKEFYELPEKKRTKKKTTQD